MINFEDLIASYWHFGAHENELSNEGDYIKFNLFDTEVVLYNDGLEIIAFDNMCPHRGAKFFIENRGNSIATCKYHGWTVANGKLHIPNRENYNKCPEYVNTYKITRCGLFIFFSVSPKETLLEQLGDYIFSLVERISFECNNLIDINEYEFNSNAIIAVENALEPDHVSFVHRKTLFPLELNNMENNFYFKNSIVKFKLGNEKIYRNLIRVAKLFDSGEPLHDGYISIHLYPFGFISSTLGISYSIQNFFPKNENNCNFQSRLYFPTKKTSSSLAAVKYFIDSTIKINREIFEEDHEICKRIDFNSWLKLIDGPLSSSEIKIKYFRENLKNLQ